MTKTSLKHIALEVNDTEKSKIFFTKILGLSFVKSFDLSPELSESIFGIKESVCVEVYENKNTIFEIFVTKKVKEKSFVHTCIEVDDKNKFISRCKDNGIEPIVVKKGEKNLLFVKDYSGNLFEIK